jgi:hypothetical protein
MRVHQSCNKFCQYYLILFAIQDQPRAGFQKLKAMFTNFINDIKSNSNLGCFEDFLDFSYEDIYLLETVFSKMATNINTVI